MGEHPVRPAESYKCYSVGSAMAHEKTSPGSAGNAAEALTHNLSHQEGAPLMVAVGRPENAATDHQSAACHGPLTAPGAYCAECGTYRSGTGL